MRVTEPQLVRLICTCLAMSALSGAGHAVVTTCNEPRLHYLDWTQKYFAVADAVFLGKVVAEEIPAPPPLPQVPDDVTSMAELLEIIESAQQQGAQPERLQEATFEVRQSWKGTATPKIDVLASLHWSDMGSYATLRMSQTYLVFAFRKDSDDRLRIPDACALPVGAEDTESAIRVLDALTKRP